MYKDSRHQKLSKQILKQHTKKNRVLKVNNCPLKLGKYFKAINLSIGDMDKSDEKEQTKKNVCKKYLLRLV